jgi:hypothetical protein
MKAITLNWLKRFRLARHIRAIRHGGRHAYREPFEWVRAPVITPGSRVCIFVMLARGDQLLPHSIEHARAWHNAGFKVVVVVIVDSLTTPIDTAPVDFANAVLLRINRGYDFGAWAAAIRLLGKSVSDHALLVTANDSVLGPSNQFATMLQRAERLDADVVGLVESMEVTHHFQSFVLFFKPLALQSKIFHQFWGSIRSGDRSYVIEHYELPLRDRFTAAGLRVEALCPARPDSTNNPTLSSWQDTLDMGLPYIKIQLLRTNPHGASLKNWRGAAEQRGFDAVRLDHAIKALESVDKESWAYRKNVIAKFDS